MGYNIYGVAASEVIVDILTGSHIVTRVDLIEDVGDSMSPCVDMGQIEGAFIMGLGFWTTEDTMYTRNGKILTNRTWNYKVPGIQDIPVDFRVQVPSHNPNPTGVLHSKGERTNVVDAFFNCRIFSYWRTTSMSLSYDSNSNKTCNCICQTNSKFECPRMGSN